jgi:hypothetical protein
MTGPLPPFIEAPGVPAPELQASAKAAVAANLPLLMLNRTWSFRPAVESVA